MKEVKQIFKLEEIFSNYDIFILDQWGVIHNGKSIYLKALDCINKLITYNKKLIIISNSSKRKDTTVLNLKKLGFKTSDFIEVMTSGEMIWQSLAYKKHLFTKNLGKNCFHIYEKTNQETDNFIEGLDNYKFVENINNADFILGCTPYKNKKVIDFVPLLDEAIKKKLPFICANPDYDSIDDNFKYNYCIGTIANLYKNMGGKIFILGKPNQEIYKKSIAKLKQIDKSRILAIGDSIYHDIQGANNFGIDSLLITATGIHHINFDKKNPIWINEKNTLSKLGMEPTFICSNLKF